MMKAIAYCNPLVPPEWIDAHGLSPQWLVLGHPSGHAGTSLARGVCPAAGEILAAIHRGQDAAAVVLTTTCDQVRRMAEEVERRSDVPLFLMNVPATWQSEAARQLYVDELRRLGRFLVALGGNEPSPGHLAEVMLDYDRRRMEFQPLADGLSGRQAHEALVALRCGKGSVGWAKPRNHEGSPLPLALLGGPLLAQDLGLFDLVEQCGASIVLDGTDAGERTLPARLDAARARQDPMAELAHAYFDTIPDVFRRPNDALYAWLGREIAARSVRGVLLRRYVWCDLWHAEVQRLKQWCPVPVLDLDAADDEDSVAARTVGRIEAFLEMIRCSVGQVANLP